MVKTITLIQVHNNSNEEITQQVEDILNVEEQYPVEEHISQLEDDITRFNQENNTNEELDDKPKTKGTQSTKQYANY